MEVTHNFYRWANFHTKEYPLFEASSLCAKRYPKIMRSSALWRDLCCWSVNGTFNRICRTSHCSKHILYQSSRTSSTQNLSFIISLSPSYKLSHLHTNLPSSKFIDIKETYCSNSLLRIGISSSGANIRTRTGRNNYTIWESWFKYTMRGMNTNT